MHKKVKILSITLLLSLSTVSTILYGVSFGNPFGVMNPDRKMTKQEIIKATRLMAAAEFEAVQNYMQVAESTDDALVKKVFTDIANEERVHAGEFLRLLNHLDPQENEFYQKGASEVEKEIEALEQPKIIKQTKIIAQKPEITKQTIIEKVEPKAKPVIIEPINVVAGKLFTNK